MFAMQFSMAGSITVPNHRVLQTLSTRMTITAWIMAYSFADYRIVDKNTPNQVDGFNFDVLSSSGGGPAADFGNLRLCSTATGDCTGGSRKLYANHWYHVAVAISTTLSEITFFVDGALDSVHTSKVKQPIQINDLPLLIGSSVNGTAAWDGLIDDVAIFADYLTASQIQSLMFAQIEPDNFPTLLACWDFNQYNNGASNYEGDDIIFDSSPNKLHGRMQGGVFRVPSEIKPVHLKPFTLQVHVEQ
jgi:hypothetical protein